MAKSIATFMRLRTEVLTYITRFRLSLIDHMNYDVRFFALSA